LPENTFVYLFSEQDKTLSPDKWQPYIFTIQGNVRLDNIKMYYAEIDGKIFD